MANYQKTKAQIQALGIPFKIEQKETLNGLAEIAAYLDWGITKTRHYIKCKGLPATQAGRNYFTTKQSIQQWVREQHLRDVETHNWDHNPVHYEKYPGQFQETRKDNKKINITPEALKAIRLYLNQIESE
jgi:hypothetical protein